MLAKEQAAEEEAVAAKVAAEKAEEETVRLWDILSNLVRLGVASLHSRCILVVASKIKIKRMFLFETKLDS